MQIKKLRVWFGILCLIVIAMGCNRNILPSPTRTHRPEVGGFYVNEPSGFDSLPSLRAHSNVLEEVYPLWYHVGPDGSLEEEPIRPAIKVAKKDKIRIFPLVNVVPNQDNVLRDPVARNNAINNILRIVKRENYDGINIDFEFVPTTGHMDFRIDRQEMTQFVKSLSTQMSKFGKETHMAVLPVVGVSPEMSGVYDYKGLAPYLHKVTVMCYDHSQVGSPPGPLAPFDWVEENIKESIRQGFKPSQICLGVATYGYDWPAGKSGGFSAPSRAILQRAAMKGLQVKWSDQYQEPYYIYTAPDGAQREVWFENAETLKTKMNLVKKYKLSGICIWRLGYEDPKFWRTIENIWGKK